MTQGKVLRGWARSASAMAVAGKAPIVGIIMGSRSDWETMSAARDTLDELEIPCEVRVVSAHRMPDEMFEYAASAGRRGLAAIVLELGFRAGVERGTYPG